jgi:hypothetical protein
MTHPTNDREIGKFRAEYLFYAAKRSEAKAELLIAEAARYRQLADSIVARLRRSTNVETGNQSSGLSNACEQDEGA